MSDDNKDTENLDDGSTDEQIEMPPVSSDQERHDRAVAGIVFDHLVASLSIDVASQMHRMLKTGAYPLSDLYAPRDRQDIFPQLYQNQEEAQKQVERFAVFLPRDRTVKRRRLEDDTNDVSSKKIENAAATTAATTKNNIPTDAKDPSLPQPNTESSSASAVQSTVDPPPVQKNPIMPPTAALPNPSRLDIYGNAPPKEPKDMVECVVCRRQVNTLRYAPHLDKCMGLGTQVRAASGVYATTAFPTGMPFPRGAGGFS